jgi:hypothetical protein
MFALVALPTNLRAVLRGSALRACDSSWSVAPLGCSASQVASGRKLAGPPRSGGSHEERHAAVSAGLS